MYAKIIITTERQFCKAIRDFHKLPTKQREKYSNAIELYYSNKINSDQSYIRVFNIYWLVRPIDNLLGDPLAPAPPRPIPYRPE